MMSDRKMKRTLLIIAITLGVTILAAYSIASWYVETLNNIVELETNVEAKWSQVENQYQRRYDLIPNIVASVKGYMKFEQDTLERVTELRSQWGESKNIDEKMEASGQLEGFLGRLMIITETYPELESDEKVAGLMAELAGTENRISTERKRYNEAVQVVEVQVAVQVADSGVAVAVDLAEVQVVAVGLVVVFNDNLFRNFD